MILRSVLLAGLLALEAAAFLVPLEVAKEVGSALTKAQLESLLKSNAHTLQLPCTGCTFHGPAQDGLEYSESDANAIVINLLVDDELSLQINGQTVLTLDTPTSPPALAAPQVRISDSALSRPLRLGYALEVLPPTSFHQGEIITVQLTILDLEGAPVHVDTVKIDLLKEFGSISLAKTSQIPFTQSPGASECTTSLCRFRAIMVARVRAILEAAKARAHATGAWVKSGCRGKKNGGHLHGQKEGHRDHHHHHKGHSKMHRFGHILRQTLRFFIIPALLGVIGGVMASAVGMLVGQALVYLWFRFHRGGQRGHTRLVGVAVADDEKDVLVGAELESETEAEMLPPRYEDVEAAVVEDVKE